MNRYSLSTGYDLSRRGYKIDEGDSEGEGGQSTDEEGAGYTDLPRQGKKTKGRVKLKMEYIDNKLRRYTTFSKRKTGIMKKAYELSTLTGTQVMLLVASETGHVYTFATRKLQPMITSEAGKALIQTCLNSPDTHDVDTAGQTGRDQEDYRMSASGFEETELSYHVPEHQEEDQREVSPPQQSEDRLPNNNHKSPPLMTIPPIVLAQLMKTDNFSMENKIIYTTRSQSDPVGTQALSVVGQVSNQQGHTKKPLSPNVQTFSESVPLNLHTGISSKLLSQPFISNRALKPAVDGKYSPNFLDSDRSHGGSTAEIKQEPDEYIKETSDIEVIRTMPNILKKDRKCVQKDEAKLIIPKQQNKQEDGRSLVLSNTMQTTDRLAELLKNENYKALLTRNIMKRKLISSSKNSLLNNAGVNLISVPAEAGELNFLGQGQGIFHKDARFSAISTPTQMINIENPIKFAQSQNSQNKEEIEDFSAVPQNLCLPKRKKC